MPTQNFDFRKMLRVLNRHKVDYIVIGGVAATLHGAPLDTLDLDVVHSRRPENLDRLLAALEELDAIYREPSHRRIRPTLSHVRSPGHQLLTTRFGSLDLLGTISGNLGYEDLLPTSALVTVNQRLKIRILDLEVIIASKEAAARDKDKAALPTLRSTHQELEAKKQGIR